MELTKSYWGVQNDKVRLSLPISKVNQELRQVSGFATLDNVDQADDVVLASASKDAFERFAGNIREMHEPIAAGRLVDFKEDSYYDSKTKKFYRGIYVTVYVSKGAEPTWQKVLDGTLTGFSIGGNITEQDTEFVKDANKSIRFIKGYDLNELSLVDNPCNQLSLVASIQKDAGGMTLMKGIMAETTLLNIFWCENEEIAKTAGTDSNTCGNCGSEMTIIGWFEKGEDESERVTSAVTKFLRQKEEDAVTKTNNETGEGGVQKMTDENKNDEQAADVVTSDAVNSPDDSAEALAEARKGSEQVVDEQEETGNVSDEEKAAETSEVEAEPDFEKMFNGLRDSVNETLEKNKSAVDEAVKTVESKVAEVTKAFDEKAAGFEKVIGELTEGLGSLKEERAEVAKRLDALDKATAIKKSGDVETTQPAGERLQKGIWSGTFFEKE